LNVNDLQLDTGPNNEIEFKSDGTIWRVVLTENSWYEFKSVSVDFLALSKDNMRTKVERVEKRGETDDSRHLTVSTVA
jgi:hypothetical protein